VENAVLKKCVLSSFLNMAGLRACNTDSKLMCYEQVINNNVQ